MRKISKFMVMAAAAVAITVVTSCARRSELDKAVDRIGNLENRVSALEKLVDAANLNIANLQTVVTALSSAEYVTFVVSTQDGCTMTFRSGQTVTITNGKDGKDGKDGADGTNGKDGKDGTDGKNGADGKDGSMPLISVRQAADGNWYWTVDGEWLTDATGTRIRANGEKGEKGEQGESGADGITPKLRINTVTNEWEVSVDEGKTWTSLGVKATGENGADGSDGADGNNLFKSITVGDDVITLVLADGTSLELPFFDSLKKVRDRVQSIVYMPDYADGMIAVVEGEDVTMTYSVMPAAMAYAIADQKDFLSFVGRDVMTRASSASLTVKDVVGDVEAGTLTVTATANGFVAGQYYAFALTFSDGISAYQTPFTTAFSIVEPESISIGIPGLQAGMGVVEMGSYMQLSINWNPASTTSKHVTWTSSDETKAKVDENNFVYVVGDAADGNVTITATTANGKEAQLVLTIADKKISVDTAQLTPVAE